MNDELTREREAAAPPLYSVYSYDSKTGRNAGRSQWSLEARTEDLREARARAAQLYTTGSYDKVEIKKTEYSSFQKKRTESVVETYADKDKSARRPSLKIYAIAAILIAIAALYIYGFVFIE